MKLKNFTDSLKIECMVRNENISSDTYKICDRILKRDRVNLKKNRFY